jgi:hypothetical protein
MRIGRRAKESPSTPLTAPAGMTVRREETSLSLASPLPGRRAAALLLGLLTLLAVGALVAAVRAHPATAAASAAWWVVVSCSALSVAITAPLAVLATRMRRLVVLTPGVLVVREGWGLAKSTASCLRETIRLVEFESLPEGRASLRVVAELSPTALRLLGIRDPAADGGDEDAVSAASISVCRGERREVAIFLGRLIAEWADVRFVEETAPPSSVTSAS